MYESSETGPKIIIAAMALLFGFLFIIFLYYIWSEKFGAKASSETQTSNINIVTSNSTNPTAKNMNVDSANTTNSPNVSIPKANNTTIVDTSDPDYVPPGFTKKPGAQQTKQVFNISNNIYTYSDAQAVCKAFGADLATYPQLVAAYKKGADWCNYGWTEGQLALYPTQKESWLKLQEDSETANICGKVGINGGYFDNPDLLYGVNCYGIKPPPRDNEKVKIQQKSQKEYELEQQIARIKKNIDNISINPFNKNDWSNCKA